MTYIGEGETFSHVSPKLSCDFQYSRILLANIASDREACDNERNVWKYSGRGWSIVSKYETQTHERAPRKNIKYT
mgnify:CR=1 FL=1